jgi:quinoprotein dehydrogenase-associated probable ABC transporter substrate-binding protein
MSSHCLRILAAFLSFASVATAAEERVLRVAADPNNLPFSNQRGEGFENKIAELIATDLGAKLEYTWRAQRRGFFRETLKEDRADVVIGVPEDFDLALTTAPYYTSTYVFVSRKDRHLNARSLDDVALRKLKIGVQIIGNDARNTPPVHALADRGIVDNVIGYTVYGDYAHENPPSRIIEAVVRREVDIAIVWGPLAGYFAKRQSVPLDLTPLASTADPALPFAFSIAMGVRKKDKALRDELNAVLERRRSNIEKILDEYAVPRVHPNQLASAR